MNPKLILFEDKTSGVKLPIESEWNDGEVHFFIGGQEITFEMKEIMPKEWIDDVRRDLSPSTGHIDPMTAAKNYMEDQIT